MFLMSVTRSAFDNEAASAGWTAGRIDDAKKQRDEEGDEHKSSACRRTAICRRRT